MTTFTDVLRDAGLEQRESRPPAMPSVPRGLDWRSVGKKGGKKLKGGNGSGNGNGGQGREGFI